MIATFATAVAWTAVGAAVLNLVSQWRRWRRPVAVVVVQSLTRPLLPALGAIAVAAAFTGRPALAVVALSTAAATSGFLVALARPVGGRVAAASPAAPTLTIAHGNVWFANKVAPSSPQRIVDALCHGDPDVIAISEYSDDIAAALATTTLPGDFPHHVADPDPRGHGSAIFSRRPLSQLTPPSTTPRTTAALIDGITVLAVHTPSPMGNLREWNQALDEWGQRLPDAAHPTIAIGDYNADLHHPALRAVLAKGWRDAHRELHATASVSWPTHYRLVPPFVRLDRALVNESVELLEISGAALPGSDHRVVTVTVAVPPRSSRPAPTAAT